VRLEGSRGGLFDGRYLGMERQHAIDACKRIRAIRLTAAMLHMHMWNNLQDHGRLARQRDNTACLTQTKTDAAQD
jgi:hypothetical protein